MSAARSLDTAPAAELSPYGRALAATLRALQRRATYHRNHVVTVVALAALVAAAAALLRSPRALAAVLLLVPLSGCFFLADLRLLERWQSEVLAGWQAGELELAALRSTLAADATLPRMALDAMLATLPAAGDLLAERRIRPPTRAAAAGVVRAVQRRSVDSLALNIGSSVLAVGVLVAALWLRAWMPLAGLALLALRPAAGAGLRRRRDALAAAELAACRCEPGFSEQDLVDLVASVR